MTTPTTPQHEPSYEELKAADEFVATLVPRADDMKGGYYPLWHGWALRDAFYAGVRFAASEQ